MNRSIIRFKEPVSLDEAIVKGGLDWGVTMEPLKTESGLSVPNRFAVIKENGNREVIGDVGSRYEMFTNRQQFDFLTEIIESKEVIVKETFVGGQIAGARVGITLALPQTVKIGGLPQEEHEVRAILSTSHDGSSPFRILIGMFRLVCSNGMVVQVGKGNKFNIRHTQNGLSRVAQAREALKVSWNYANTQYNNLAEKLMAKPFSQEQMESLAKNILGYREDQDEETMQKTLNQARKIVQNFAEGEDLAHVRGTGWAALQSVTHFIDHQRTVRGPLDERDAKRYENSVFGTGNDLRAKTLELLTV